MGVVPVEIRVVNLSHCDLGGRVTELKRSFKKALKRSLKYSRWNSRSHSHAKLASMIGWCTEA